MAKSAAAWAVLNASNSTAGSDMLTADEVARFTDAELALALKAAAIGSGDIEIARVVNEAAKRLTKESSQ